MRAEHPPARVFLLPEPRAAGGDPACLQWLDAGERQRAAAYAREADARAYVAAHALLRASLSQVAAAHAATISPATWRFELASRGKPHVAPGLTGIDLRFSLSHCDGLVAVAVSVGHEVGVDVERESRSVPAALRIARLRLSRDEHAALESIADAAERQRRFMSMWTGLEALAKGTGLGLGMRRLSREPDAQPGAQGMSGRQPGADRRTPWRLARWRLGDHLIALATASAHGCPEASCQVMGWDARASRFRVASGQPGPQALASD